MQQNEALLSDTSENAYWIYSVHKVSFHGSTTIRIFIKLNAFKALSASTGFTCMHVILPKPFPFTDIWYHISLMYGVYVLPSQQAPLNHAMSRTGKGLYFSTILFPGFILIVVDISSTSVRTATYTHGCLVLVCITGEVKILYNISAYRCPRLPASYLSALCFLLGTWREQSRLPRGTPCERFSTLGTSLAPCRAFYICRKHSTSALDYTLLLQFCAPLSSWGGREEPACTLNIHLSHHVHVMTGPSRCL